MLVKINILSIQATNNYFATLSLSRNTHFTRVRPTEWLTEWHIYRMQKKSFIFSKNIGEKFMVKTIGPTTTVRSRSASWVNSLRDILVFEVHLKWSFHIQSSHRQTVQCRRKPVTSVLQHETKPLKIRNLLMENQESYRGKPGVIVENQEFSHG